MHNARSWLGLLARFSLSALCALSLLLVVDSERSQALDVPVPPTTSVVDHAITWAADPELEAASRDVDESLVEQCRRSAFVVVTFSGTGMEDSHYQANMIQKVVEELGGCVMYHWYGNVYDGHASALSVRSALRKVTAPGERKQVAFVGASFGGIAAEDIASDAVISGSRWILLRKIVMIATPVDMNDVIQDVFGVPVPVIKNIPVQTPRFGDLVVLGNSLNGQRQRNQLLDPVEWRETFINAAKTRAGLMWSQLERLREGMLTVRTDIPVDYLGSPDSDATVNTDQAYQRVDNVIMAPTRYVTIEGGGHDQGWLLSSAGKYNAKLGPMLQETFGAAA